MKILKAKYLHSGLIDGDKDYWFRLPNGNYTIVDPNHPDSIDGLSTISAYVNRTYEQVVESWGVREIIMGDPRDRRKQDKR